jgi:hypothetical protein
MPLESVTSKAYFFRLSMAHLAFLLGQVGVTAIFFYLNLHKPTVFGLEAASQTWVYAAGALTIVGVLVSAQWFNTKMRKRRALPDLKQKLSGYHSDVQVRYFLLEMPAFISGIGYFQTNNLLLLIFIGLILLLLIIYRPTRERAIQDLDLSVAEQALVNDPDAVVAEVPVNTD